VPAGLWPLRYPGPGMHFMSMDLSNKSLLGQNIILIKKPIRTINQVCALITSELIPIIKKVI
jgi:hypothetical protein